MGQWTTTAPGRVALNTPEQTKAKRASDTACGLRSHRSRGRDAWASEIARNVVMMIRAGGAGRYSNGVHAIKRRRYVIPTRCQ